MSARKIGKRDFGTDSIDIQRDKRWTERRNCDCIGKRRESSMIWMEAIGAAIQYMEDHITEDISVNMIAEYVHISPFYFQKGFAMLCGFTIAEYIRNRRLALAGNKLVTGDEKIIDIAMKYGYDSPDNFTKAFTRFHGVTPTAARRERVR